MTTSEYIISGLGVLVMFFLGRTIKQLDTSVSALTGQVSELREDRKAQAQVNEMLTGEVAGLKDENQRFRRILTALDKIIYKKLGIDLNTL